MLAATIPNKVRLVNFFGLFEGFIIVINSCNPLGHIAEPLRVGNSFQRYKHRFEECRAVPSSQLPVETKLLRSSVMCKARNRSCPYHQFVAIPLSPLDPCQAFLDVSCSNESLNLEKSLTVSSLVSPSFQDLA